MVVRDQRAVKFTSSNVAPFSLLLWVGGLAATGLQMTAWYPWWPGIYVPIYPGLGVVLLFIAVLLLLLTAVRIVFPKVLLTADRGGLHLQGAMGQLDLAWDRIEHTELERSFLDNRSGSRQVMCVVFWLKSPESQLYRAVRPHGWMVGTKLFFPIPDGWDDDEALDALEKLRWGQV